MNYHFMCARDAGAQFQDDKRVYCAQHSFRANKEVSMRTLSIGRAQYSEHFEHKN